jgi:predicted ATP-grasp superfamily ATP-dependent carboligase
VIRNIQKGEINMAGEVSMAQKQRVCKVEGCTHPYRAKGYCNVHYKKWRRGEMPKPRYKTCNYGVRKLKQGEKKECLKPVYRGGLCEEHYHAKYAKKGKDK